MIEALSVILLCQLAGEIAARGLGVPVPGPVLGLVLLLILLLLRDRVPRMAIGPLRGDGLISTAKGLLANLSLLFVPAGVGIVQFLDVLRDEGAAIALVLAVSVIATLAVTVATFLIVSRVVQTRRGRQP